MAVKFEFRVRASFLLKLIKVQSNIDMHTTTASAMRFLTLACFLSGLCLKKNRINEMQTYSIPDKFHWVQCLKFIGHKN